MNRAEVRIIENQTETNSPVNISDWERNQLLLKYGYQNQQVHTTNTHQTFDPTRDLSYEELIALEDRKHQEKLMQRYQQVDNQPRSYTLDNSRVQYNESKYSTVDGLNFGFEVQIFSDMKINR